MKPAFLENSVLRAASNRIQNEERAAANRLSKCEAAVAEATETRASMAAALVEAEAAHEKANAERDHAQKEHDDIRARSLEIHAKFTGKTVIDAQPPKPQSMEEFMLSGTSVRRSK